MGLELRVRNRFTGEEMVIEDGGWLSKVVCKDCGGYIGPFEYETNATIYCDCWEIVKPKKEE